MPLFHVSAESGTRRFQPRPAPAPSKVVDAIVWAIDEAHLPNYLLPRDCPRVTYRPRPTTSADDCARFFTGRASHIVAISADWLERAIDCVLFLYQLPAHSFELLDMSAGYWVSREPVEPDSAIELRQPLLEIARRGVELRVVPNLWELREAVLRSTVDFSIIRMKLAAQSMPIGRAD
jgi:hypothetical protein